MPYRSAFECDVEEKCFTGINLIWQTLSYTYAYTSLRASIYRGKIQHTVTALELEGALANMIHVIAFCRADTSVDYPGHVRIGTPGAQVSFVPASHSHFIEFSDFRVRPTPCVSRARCCLLSACLGRTSSLRTLARTCQSRSTTIRCVTSS